MAWLVSNQRNDGSWGTRPETFVSNTALALQGLQAAGINRGSYPYASGATWLLNVNPGSIDSLARQISALSASGTSVIDKLKVLEAALNVYVGWGSYAGFDTSYPDTALALSAYRISGFTFDGLRWTVYCEILPSQLANGGWGYFNPRVSGATAGPTSAAIVPSAYNIVELQRINTDLGWDNDTCPDPGGSPGSIVTALDGAKAFLLTNKNADGGFGPAGVSTVIDTALAYLALRTMNPADSDAAAALDFLLGQQDAGATPAKGSWNGDSFQTALVMSVLPAPVAPLADTDQDGIPNGVETELGTDPDVPDSRSLSVGGGNTWTGLSVPNQYSAQAFQLVPFSSTLSAAGGQPPYAWQIASGTLPPGLSLASSGTIAGTPSTVGTYSFTLAVRDTSGAAINVPGSIAVQTGNVLPALLLLLLDN